MPTLRALIVDDDEGFCDKVKQAIEAASASVTVVPIRTEELNTGLRELHSRRDAARAGRSTTWDENVFDTADILFVDYDLVGLEEVSLANGEDLAYLARVFSRCGVILGLNQFGRNTFDLSMIRDGQSWADVNLGSEQVAGSFLWREQGDAAFAPWSWPLVPQAHSAFLARTTRILESLDVAMQDALPLLSEPLPTDTAERLLGDGTLSWRAWVTSKCLRVRDRQTALDDTALARIAAAKIGSWMERAVLARQDILVDAPHLVSRYPALLDDPADLKAWASTCTRSEPVRVTRTEVQPCLLQDWALWLSRPAWSWPKLRELASGKGWERPPTNAADVVFCEDVSAFVQSSDAKEYRSGLSTPFARRYMRDVAGVDYEPRVRRLSVKS